jgi:aminoglycoside phosphotransferase family enzyme/predicted kinase
MTETTLPPLIQQMLQPEFYPHGVTEPIQLIQTHVSYVLLTGDYAYKVKKPVNFGFLDYSTLEQRHHFCQEELRLNQRTAADLYLAVVPLVQVGDRYQFGTDAIQTIVDYAVQMRQFPQDALLTTRFERGELTPERLQDLARAIAAFHRQTVTNDYIRSFGEIPSIRQSIDENYDQTEQYIGGPQTQRQFDETRAYTDRFFAERADIFQARMAGDRIRECHGDLHLRNICDWQGKLWLFDCIEFNEPFRFVDVMFDIAYIVMDLLARDRPDLSALFLNTYVEESGDWEGLAVLPLYVSRQTYVRAKVTSFLLNDPAIAAADKQAIADTAARYYRLAWQLTTPQPGQIILMAGLSGSGKTTLGRALATQLNGVHIRSDAVRKHLGGIPLYERGAPDLYTPAMTANTYDRLLHLGVSLAQDGYTVILDAKYDRQSLRQAAIAQAQQQGIPLHILHCDAPLNQLAQRLQTRTGDIADATVDVLQRQTFEAFSDTEQPYVIPLDATQSPAELLTQSLAKLGGTPS